MRLLLDTCTFLWVATDDGRLSPDARRAVADPDNEAYVSAVTAWEIGIKHALGKLPLDGAPHEVVVTLREALGLSPLPLDEVAALQAGRLPPLHRDPFDRALVAQAMLGGMRLVTPDPLLSQYGVPTLW